MKNINLKKIGAVVLLLVIVVGGIFIVKKRQSESDNAPVASTFPLVVTTLKIADNSGALTLPYLALAQNDQDITLTSKIAARIIYLKPSGTPVSAGEVIAKLDNSTFQTNVQGIQSQIMAQETTLKNLESAHKRTMELLAIKGASKEQSENEISKIAEVTSRIAALEQSKNDLSNSLSYTTIKAPNTGILSKTMMNVGDVAMPGQPIATISAKSGGFLKLRVPSDLKIKGIRMQNSFYPVTPLNRTYNGLAEYKINVPSLKALTGERIPVDVVLDKSISGLTIPFDAILNREGKSFVFLVEDNKTRPLEITIQSSGENEAIISNTEISGKEIVLAKQDILLRLLGGATIKVNQKK